MAKEIALEMINITKEFSAVKALNGVNFSVNKGEIHALIGENGAGKSTLMKILSGVYSNNSYKGEIKVFGEEQKFHKPKDAQESGIAIIHQELALINEISVAENIYLGRWDSKGGLVNWKSINDKTKEVLKQLNLDIDVRTKVKKLGVGQQQLVEITKALSLDSRILILDEPTAALTDSETIQLFEVLRELKKKGMTMIYISHRMQEIFQLADRITVLRDGMTIGTENIEDVNHKKIVSMMIGREISSLYPDNYVTPGIELLKIEKYSVPHPDKAGKMLIDNVNFSVRAGEIIGISGLLGSGRTELVSAIFGAYKRKGTGRVLIKGQLTNIKNPKQAIKNGMAFLTEDRKQSGLILKSSISKNISLASLKKISRNGILNTQIEFKLAENLSKDLRVKMSSVGANVSSLSGGNQQKVVLAKWLATKPKILILDEPTRGVDVGAKSEIYHIMKELASNGAAIIMVSSDLPEVIGMSDRVYVMHEGKITGELKKSELTEERIMHYATGA